MSQCRDLILSIRAYLVDLEVPRRYSAEHFSRTLVECTPS